MKKKNKETQIDVNKIDEANKYTDAFFKNPCRNWKAFVPQYPFRGHIEDADTVCWMPKDGSNFKELINTYGGVRDPLDDDELNLLQETFGTLNLSLIEDQLPAKYTPDVLKSWTWKKLLSRCKAQRKSRNTTRTKLRKENTLDRPPLGKIASLIYVKLKSLPKHEGMTCPKIADWLSAEHGINIDEASLRKNHIPQLKPYGLQHVKRIGYYIRG